MTVISHKAMTMRSLSLELIVFSRPRVSGSTSGKNLGSCATLGFPPWLIPPHSVAKHYTNSLCSCIVRVCSEVKCLMDNGEAAAAAAAVKTLDKPEVINQRRQVHAMQARPPHCSERSCGRYVVIEGCGGGRTCRRRPSFNPIYTW